MQNLSMLQNKIKQKTSSAKNAKAAAKEDNLVKDDTDHTIPDRSFGDLYCAICDSHMNNEAMWTAHVIGKKHTKNVKKEGGPEKKYEVLEQPCSVQDELDKIEGEPVVGLKHIDEIYRKNSSGPIFMCYLCHSNVSMGSLLIEHVLSYKHRLAYVKETDPKQFHSLDVNNFSKGGLETLLTDISNELEERFGRGSITVKKEIEKQEVLQTWSAKKFPRPVTPPILSYPNDVQLRSYGESLARSEINGASSYQRSLSPFGQQLRPASPPRYRLYSPSPPRRYSELPPTPPRKYPELSPPRRYRERSPSPPRRYRERSPSPPRRYRERSPSPSRRYRERSPSPSQRYRDRSSSPSRRRREHSLSPHRRHRELSPGKKMRNREKRSKPSEKSRKKQNTRSSSSSSSSCSALRERLLARQAAANSQSHSLQPEREHLVRRLVEDSQQNDNQLGIRNPSFNVLHRSPVQHSVSSASSSNPNIFMSTGAIPKSSVSQVLFNNDNYLNSQGAANASVTNGPMFENEYAPRHMALDNIILRNTQRNIPGLDGGYSFEEARRMVLVMSNNDFLNLVSEKLEQLPVTTESNRLLEQLQFKIENMSKNRRDLHILRNVFQVTSMPSNSVETDPRDAEPPMVNAMIRQPGPLEAFIAMSRRKMEN